MRVAIIPARGGSKRIPRKNIRNFCGRPMIAWPIGVAIDSGMFDHVVISTDDDEIARVSTDAGAEVPFRRPNDLADDYAPTRVVVNHAIGEVERLFGRPDYTCCIYPTAPFLRADDLRRAFDLMVTREADFAFSATSYAYPIQRALKLTEGGGVAMFWPEHQLARSQDLEPAFHDAGQFYWGRTEAFLAGRRTFSDASVAIILPRYRVHDIDTEEDWLQAELAFDALQRSTTAGTGVQKD